MDICKLFRKDSITATSYCFFAENNLNSRAVVSKRAAPEVQCERKIRRYALFAQSRAGNLIDILHLIKEKELSSRITTK